MLKNYKNHQCRVYKRIRWVDEKDFKKGKYKVLLALLCEIKNLVINIKNKESIPAVETVVPIVIMKTIFFFEKRSVLFIKRFIINAIFKKTENIPGSQNGPQFLISAKPP